jgi:hypothetical protein
MFFVKATNCCEAIRFVLDNGPDGGACPPYDNAAPCRGYAGECGTLQVQFAAVPILPDYPDGLADFNCAAFPDDDKPVRACHVA